MTHLHRLQILFACFAGFMALSFTSMVYAGAGSGQPQRVVDPVITTWYGNTLPFGALGNPVPDINILGNVAPSKGLISLTYTLNGGEQETLTVGPDNRRLERVGDFNIDIPYRNLTPGTNQIIIIATDAIGAVRETVAVNYTAGQTWSLPYSINWSSVGRIDDAGQVLDGRWSIQSGAVRPLELGYDRMIAIGDQQWSDYEITVPVTILSIDSAGFAPPSNGCLVGFLMRWPGNGDLPIDVAGRQPKTGYLPFGALGANNWNAVGQRMTILGNNLRLVDQDSTGRTLLFNTPYVFKMRVETTPGNGGLYMMKVWEAADSEPVEWDLVGQEDPTDPQRGCVTLIAHHVDALFGNVSVVPAKTTIPSSIVSDDFNTPAINTSLWTLVNPLADASFSLSGTNTPNAWVNIGVPGGTAHDPWTSGNNAPRLIQPANNTDFEVEAKFESGISQRYQLQGIIAEESQNSFIRFEFHSDGTSTRMFVASLVNNVPTIRLNAVLGPNGTAPLYMRVKRVGNGWLMKYSLDGNSWTNATSFNHIMNLTGIGPYGANSGTPPPAFTANIDYFFNTNSPIIPEDSTHLNAPVITQQPVNDTVNVGQTATFTVVASGSAPLLYQWRKNGVNIIGAISASYTTPPVSSGDNGAEFRCVVSNTVGSAPSAQAILTVISPPAITQQPVSDTVNVGQTATFSVVASGTAPLSYRWQKNGSNISGATSASYTTPPVSSGDNGAAFRCVVTNTAGSVTSAQAILTVNAIINPPLITQQPVNATVHVGEMATFTVVATGTPPLLYQWQKNGANILGAIFASYTTPPVAAGDNGAHFRCRVSNVIGSTTSNEATLHVINAENRVTTGLLALYTFHEGSGNEVSDVSGVLPPLDLEIANPSRVAWHPGYLSINRKTVVRSDGPAIKIITAAMLTNEVSIEAWIRPGMDDDDHDDSPSIGNPGLSQGDGDDDDDDGGLARIVSNAEKQTMKRRNFSLESFNDNYIGRARTTVTDNQIRPNATSPDDVVDDELTHLLYTRSDEGVAKLFINGVAVTTANVGGNFSNWDLTYPLSIANEVSLNRPWYGDVHLVAIYGRALSPSEVQQNYGAGPDPELGVVAIAAKPSLPIDELQIPDAYMLHQNYPNPFNPETHFDFSLPEGGDVSLVIYDVLGRRIAELVSGVLGAGNHSVTWNGESSASGVYIARFRVTGATGEQVYWRSNKLILMR